jgi:hypothetical protein
MDNASNDKLKLTCHHGRDSHEVESTLDFVREGPSPLEAFLRDDQTHERVAMGLHRVPRAFFAKAGENVRKGVERPPPVIRKPANDQNKKDKQDEDKRAKRK